MPLWDHLLFLKIILTLQPTETESFIPLWCYLCINIQYIVFLSRIFYKKLLAFFGILSRNCYREAETLYFQALQSLKKIFLHKLTKKYPHHNILWCGTRVHGFFEIFFQPPANPGFSRLSACRPFKKIAQPLKILGLRSLRPCADVSSGKGQWDVACSEG